MDKYYQVLGLKPGASKAEIKQAYRDLARVWHPDRFPTDERLRLTAQEKLKEINEAYEKLSSLVGSPSNNKQETPRESDKQESQNRQGDRKTTPSTKRESMSSKVLNNKAILVVILFLTVVTVFWLFSKPKRIDTSILSPQDSIAIVNDNIDHRAEVDSSFRYDESSPFKRDTTIEYHGIKWFLIDPRYRGQSVLHRYDRPETVIVLGTKGEERKQLRYGCFEFDVPDESGDPVTLRIDVYKFTPYDSNRYALYKDNLSVWFTDRTTGLETYGVGRYVEIGNEHPDPSHVYVIDLNKAYNPYCAYSALFSCAIPRKEDHLDVALRVGEMKYHE